MRITVSRALPAPDRAAALERARELAGAAAAAGAALLLLPQRFAAGWARDAARLEAAAEPSDGPTAAAMREVAGRTGVALAYGYVERCTGRCFDSLLLIDRDGRCLVNYRRTHAQPDDEALLLGHGQWLSAMPLGRWRLGLLSGHDLAHPEPARALRLVGCDLLLVAGARSMPTATETFLRARAAENRCHLAFASAAADLPPEVLGPDGAPLARLTGPSALVIADLPERPPAPDPALLRDRRPRLYHRLVAVEPGGADGPA